MEMMVDLGSNSYPIYIEKGLLDHVLEKLQTFYHGQKIMIMTDDHVDAYYGDNLVKQLSQGYKVDKIVVKHGEQSKNFEILPSLYQRLLDFKLTRSDLIIALGGGVIGDLCGFVAATYLRGVKLVQIPTSLLAQVDSSVGGKVAVDLDVGKNLVGAFYHPKMVIIDPLVLKTLPDEFIADGMGEVIKYGCIKDKKLFDKLNAYASFEELYEDIDEIIYTCVDIKRIVVENDEKDFGDRLILNFGHTIGHTIEQYFHYSEYTHGQAVGIGMVQICKLAEKLGLTKTGTADSIAAANQKYNIQTSCGVLMQDLVETITLDKKNFNNHLSLVLLKEIGEAYVYPTNVEIFKNIERV